MNRTCVPAPSPLDRITFVAGCLCWFVAVVDSKAMDADGVQLEWTYPMVTCGTSGTGLVTCQGHVGYLGRAVDSMADVEISTSLIPNYKEAPNYDLLLSWTIDQSGAVFLYWPPLIGASLQETTNIDKPTWTSLSDRSPFVLEPALQQLESGLFRLNLP